MDFRKKENLISNPNIMNKNILRNSKYLVSLGRKARGDESAKVDKIIDLYKSRKISQLQTAENIIMKLISKDQKIKASGAKLYDKSVVKHVDVEPLSHRLREKTTLRNIIKNVEVGDPTKAKTEIIIHINQKDMIKRITDADGNQFDYNNHADYDFMYNSIKNRLHSEVEKVMKIKKSMKIQHVVDFIIKRQRKNEQDPKPKFPDSYIKKIDGSFWE